MSQEQNPANPIQATPEELGSLDAAALAFQKREEVEATAETEDKAEADAEAQDADPNADADGATDEDTEQPEALAEVEYEGKTYKVPPELEKALLRQADYSRKMNVVGQQEKAYAQRLEQAEALATSAEKYAEKLAGVKVLDAQIQQFGQVNWQQLEAENPAQYAVLAVKLQRLQSAKERAEAEAKSVSGEVEEGKFQALAAERAEMETALKKTFPNWGDEMGRALTAYATENGVKLKTLQTLTDPGMVLALEKARKFDALQKSKAELRVKTKDAPKVLKPGAPRNTTPAADAMANLQKYKSRDAAEAAFLSRMR